MNLSGLLPLLQGLPTYRELIKGGDKQRVTLPDVAKPLLLASLYHDLNTPLLVITPNPEGAKRLHDELMAYCRPGTAVHLFPEVDTLPYERLAPDPAAVRQRLEVLAVLRDMKETASIPLVVISAHALFQKTLAPALFSLLRLSTGQKIELSRLLGQLVTMGYEICEIVERYGEASKRGGIIDVYSPNFEFPARIELLGNVVESIRWFDPATQRSTGKADSIAIVPARETIPPKKEALQTAFSALDLSHCSDKSKDVIREEMELLLNGQWRDGLEFYAPLFDTATIMDYLPPQALLVLDDPQGIAGELASLELQATELRLGQMERGELPKNFPLPYSPWAELQPRIAAIGKSMTLEAFGEGRDSEGSFSFVPAASYVGSMARFLETATASSRKRQRLVIISQQASRLAELLGEKDVLTVPVEQIDKLPPAPSLTLVHGSLSEGWTLGETSIFTDTELFGFTKKRRSAPRRREQQELFLSDLSAGDYVVHIDHGIARFSGIRKMSADGTERDYLVLEYAEGDKLYVPSDQVDRVNRYIGPGGQMPALSRLNTQEWARTKQRVKKAAEDMARELLAIFAAREVSEGFAFSPDTLWQQELEASFPYVETPDQLRAIQEIKKDMENPKPMDRLVCGDVGYGKTEVALRAAFKAVMDSKQVVVLVPTTVLAQQHFKTFSDRFAAFPMKIEMLSRFRSPKEQQAVLEKLANRTVDICIGTHRLLQKDVVFADLGLVIIDEEQKFGVVHKERLKQLRSEVDVITLSATPIPRTLHMALVGVRDMSTMETPPEERLPIKTVVAEYDDELVREAILRELDRKGQVFFLHNRVQSIGFIAHQLAELVPEAKIAVAHGQMPEDELESTMLDFISGRTDVLVCTTIVESGIDLPSANTLIVNKADNLGLTQLYHLRGRVGRGDVRAYAYFLYERGKQLTEPARKRLKTIFEATELGSGFRIAMKDLEIRGAGNILGPEQSGHVGAVGFDLYCRLLSGAVDELKLKEESAAPLVVYPLIELPVTAFVPEAYVPDMNTRLTVYQRLSRIDSLEKLKDLQQEMEDRFGKVPEPAQNLLFAVRIKIIGAAVGIQKVATEGHEVVVVRESGVDRAGLQRAFGTSVRVGATQVHLDTRKLGKFWTRILEQVLRAMKK